MPGCSVTQMCWKHGHDHHSGLGPLVNNIYVSSACHRFGRGLGFRASGKELRKYSLNTDVPGPQGSVTANLKFSTCEPLEKTGGSWVTIRRIRAQAIIALIVVPTIETLLATIWMAVKIMVPFLAP